MSDLGVLRRFDLSNRVMIITGGAGLLGKSYAQTLSAAGAHVVVADLDGESADQLAKTVTEASGVDALGIETHVSKPEAVKAMAGAVMEHFGHIEVLMNNAALDPKFDAEHTGEHTNRFEDFPFSAWQEALAVNVTGMFLCAQAVAPAMLEAGRVVIANVSSTKAWRGRISNSTNGKASRRSTSW